MSQRLRKQRDRAAESVLRRIRRDRNAVSEVRLREPLLHIEQRLFDRDFDAGAMWRDVGVKAHTASAWFHELDPKTPAKYINARRLDTAAGMLRLDEDRTAVWKIAEEVGFTLSSFNDAFKARFGQTPTAYREAQADPAAAALVAADTALAAGSPWAALDHLEGLDDTRADVAARLGLAWHGRAADEVYAGKVDDAYRHLARARHCYDVAGELPPRVRRHRVLTAVSRETDGALLDALCPPCGAHLRGDTGESVRRHLRDALRLLPTDLAWFGVCCDECYRVVWKAVSLARYGFLSDAWQAWWLYRHADLDDPHGPPSVGRFVGFLDQVEGELHFQNQKERLVVAERAHVEAKALGQPLLELEARFWCGNVLRALAQFPEARKRLKLESDLDNLWQPGQSDGSPR